MVLVEGRNYGRTLITLGPCPIFRIFKIQSFFFFGFSLETCWNFLWGDGNPCQGRDCHLSAASRLRQEQRERVRIRTKQL